MKLMYYKNLIIKLKILEIFIIINIIIFLGTSDVVFVNLSDIDDLNGSYIIDQDEPELSLPFCWKS